MPCTAPSRNNLRVQGPCGYETYAAGLCKPHYQLKNGLIVPSPGVDQYTVLLLHCDGPDGSTSFPDSSPSAKAVTASGTAKVSTAQSVFGSSSALLNTGGAGTLSIPDSPDFTFGAGDFTIDFWVRFAGIAAAQVLLAQRTTGMGWTITWLNTNFLRFFYSTDGVTPVAYNPAWAAAANTWYHIAFVRAGPTMRFFVNGVQVGADGNIGAAAIFDSPDPIQVGAELVGSTSFTGNMDEIRISKTARWTSNFSPPTAPY